MSPSKTRIAGREVTVGDPWLNDGNIVLVTHEEPTAFLVHRGVLSRHSDMFKDMFEVVQTTTDEHQDFGASQVVTMYDNPTDLSSLIKALYDGVTSDNAKADNFFQLAGVLRLATKYCAQRIRLSAIRLLAQTWPYTLKDHDTMTMTAMTAPVLDNLTYPYVHPLHVLNLARETEVDLLVPSSLYFLSIYPLSEILTGDHPKLAVTHPSRPSSQLSPKDLQCYTLMYQHRLQVGLDFVRQTCGKWTSSSTNSCANSECSKSFSRLASRVQRSWNPKTAAIFFMLQITHEAMSTDNICSPCRRAFSAEVDELRTKTWDVLPSIAGLPEWPELINRDMGS